jgi:hypothetical protein
VRKFASARIYSANEVFMMFNSAKNALLSGLVALAAFLAVPYAAIATPGNTGQSGVKVSIISIEDNSTPNIYLKVLLGNGTWYYANKAGCPSTNNDTVKMWESIFMSAFLSGKKVVVYFDTEICSGVGISNVDIKN